MTKEELKKQLDEKGIKYSSRASVAELQKLLELPKEVTDPASLIPLPSPMPDPETLTPEQKQENKINAAMDDLTGRTRMTTEELTEGTRTSDGVIRKSGIVIPTQVLQSIPKTRWVYSMECTSERCVVSKTHGINTEVVRAYEREVHGEGFAGLAKQFVDKNNQ